MAGKYAGESVFIPRIPLIPNGDDLPVEWKRLQFPVRLSYAMTINKSQGQSLKVVGLNLDTPVFFTRPTIHRLFKSGQPKIPISFNSWRKDKECSLS